MRNTPHLGIFSYIFILQSKAFFVYKTYLSFEFWAVSANFAETNLKL